MSHGKRHSSNHSQEMGMGWETPNSALSHFHSEGKEAKDMDSCSPKTLLAIQKEYARNSCWLYRF